MFSFLSIRQKFLGTILFITFFLITIFHTLTSHVIQNSYNQLENKMVVEITKRVQATFNTQVQELDDLVQDWARLDNTCRFVTDHNANQESIFSKEAFVKSTKIDLLLIFNTKKSLIHSAILNKDHLLRDVKPALLSSIHTHSHLLDHTSQAGSMMGIVQLDNRFLLIAAKPIYDSLSKEMVCGTLIIGKIIDAAWTEQLETITQTSLSFHPVFKGPPDTVNASQTLLLSSSPYHVSALSQDTIKGYTLLNDVSGKAVLVLAVDLKREIHNQVGKTLTFLLKTIIFISIIFGLIFFLFIDIIISRRLTAIIFDIKKIERSSKQGARVRESLLKDELGQLAVSINRMLEANESLEEYKAKGKKIEALTTFAAGASHELATPLSTIAVASGEILYDLTNNNSNKKDLYDDIFLIREQVDRCKYILNQMAADAGQQLGEKVVSFSTETLINETLMAFDQTTSEKIEVDNQIVDQFITMPLQGMCRVLRGIIRNGIDASEPESPIFISCAENTTHLLLEIRDNGTGMDDHTLKHALDPFFTTKPPGDNLGLGLYLAQSLTSRFGGNIQVSSSHAIGTTVTLSFAKEHIYV